MSHLCALASAFQIHEKVGKDWGDYGWNREVVDRLVLVGIIFLGRWWTDCGTDWKAKSGRKKGCDPKRLS
jgi:hypothetical protein